MKCIFYEMKMKIPMIFIGFSGWLSGKNKTKQNKQTQLSANAGEASLIPGWGRYPGGGNGNPFQYPCLGIPIDRGAWWATIHGFPKSQTRLSDYTTATT